jgi:ABC-type multidrug transport system ATPase subunit
MISHRPKVIQRADWIVMLELGRLQIQGTPEQLRQIKGDHLNFLDDIMPVKNDLAIAVSTSYLNGKPAGSN